MRFLLIDDDPDDRALAARTLAQEFASPEIVEVLDAAALEAALGAPVAPNLAVTDYELRWSDGLAAFRRIKAVHPDCPVVMFTGTGNEEVAVEAMKAGLDDYIVKSRAHLRRLGASARAAIERAAQRRALRDAETRYRDLFRSVPVGLYRCAPDGAFRAGNPALLALLGLDEAALRGANLNALIADGQAVLPPEAAGDGPWSAEVRLRRPDGRELWALNSVRRVREAGRAAGYEGALVDVTAQRALLAEKETLLAEVHHRVKNNLQVISSLLRLEALEAATDDGRERLEKVARRVEVLARIHEQLYTSADCARIDFGRHLEQLCGRLAELHQAATAAVTVAVEAEGLRCGLEIAVPLGLIAHELISNSLKHAFPAGRGGTVRVAFRRASSGPGIELVVADDGIGAPPGARGSGGGLGWHLVGALAGQLGARVRHEVAAGTRVTVAVPGEWPGGASDEVSCSSRGVAPGTPGRSARRPRRRRG